MTKILILTANPYDTTRLRVNAEMRDIQGALKRTAFQVVLRSALRIADLSALLEEQPAIVHFAGHGDAGGILLETHTGDTQAVPPTALAELFGLFRDGVRCVVLNACHTAAQAEALAAHIDWVVGQEGDIGDDAAHKFATAFYTALGDGSEVATAFAYAEKTSALADSAIRPRLYQKPDARPFPELGRVPEGNTGSTAIFTENLTYLGDSGLHFAWRRPKEPLAWPAPDWQGAAMRTSMLEDLARALDPAHSQRWVVLYGRSGTGKTTLAAQFIDTHAKEDIYQGGVLWADIGPHFAPDRDIQPILDRWAGWAYPSLKPGQRLGRTTLRIRAEEVQQALSSHGSMLVVFDDVRDFASIKPLLKAVPADANILITAREHLEMDHAQWFLPLEIGSLTAEEGVQWLRQRVPTLPEDQCLELAKVFTSPVQALALIANELAHQNVKETRDAKVQQFIEHGIAAEPLALGRIR